jgi:hypothetical protein
MSTISNNISDINNIMSGQSTAMKNIDDKRVLSVGPELQKSVQETQQAAHKGTTEGFKQSLYKINILV